VDAVVAQVRRRRPELDVTVGYLDHGPPSITDAVDADCIGVPLLLTSGYHVRVDLPAQSTNATVAKAIGPDPALAQALAGRLGEAGYDDRSPVVLAAAGSSDDRALDDVRAMASHLAELLDVEVTAAFVASGSPRLDETRARAVSSYLLAPGAFHDAVRASGAHVVSAPLGAHPVVADLVLARYDAVRGQTPGRTAPA
jgi:sirohydrochlorin ferrochelatase